MAEIFSKILALLHYPNSPVSITLFPLLNCNQKSHRFSETFLFTLPELFCHHFSPHHFSPFLFFLIPSNPLPLLPSAAVSWSAQCVWNHLSPSTSFSPLTSSHRLIIINVTLITLIITIHLTFIPPLFFAVHRLIVSSQSHRIFLIFHFSIITSSQFFPFPTQNLRYCSVLLFYLLFYLFFM